MSRAQLSRLQDYTLVDTNQDLRGCKVWDSAGSPLGRIDDMIVDTDKECVTAILLDDQTEYSIYDLLVADQSIVVAPGVQPIAAPLDPAAVPPRRLASDNLGLPGADNAPRTGKRLSEMGEVRVSRRSEGPSDAEVVQRREEQAETLQQPADPLLKLSPHRPASAIP